jgi:UDP:flavonoid glycosyltransferase YjiC (YdhE family)
MQKSNPQVLPPERPESEEPLVLVSMSTTDMGQVDLLRRTVAALDQLPVRGLVTTGPGVDPNLVAGTRRVAVVPAAPHNQIMRHASAVISHGGHGTVIKALANGLPQLVIPLGRDQPNNAARITHHGTGLQLKPTATTDVIAHSVQRLLHNDDIARRAARLGAAVLADAEESSVVQHLERVVQDTSGDEQRSTPNPDHSSSSHAD